jgi:hypothetical protein
VSMFWGKRQVLQCTCDRMPVVSAAGLAPMRWMSVAISSSTRPAVVRITCKEEYCLLSFDYFLFDFEPRKQCKYCRRSCRP